MEGVKIDVDDVIKLVAYIKKLEALDEKQQTALTNLTLVAVEAVDEKERLWREIADLDYRLHLERSCLVGCYWCNVKQHPICLDDHVVEFKNKYKF